MKLYDIFIDGVVPEVAEEIEIFLRTIPVEWEKKERAET